MAEVRVAMVATPDAANLGDLLFPLLAQRELSVRLGEIELTCYGYRGLAAAHWPFPVRSLGALPEEIAGYDLVLIGGGQIVHTISAIAHGYIPSDPRVHQPLGFWLIPALLAHLTDVPVAWNAVGAEPLPEWLAPLARAALTGSAYVAVRDERSVKALGALVPEAALQLVPDTAFGALAILDEAARQAAQELRSAAGIGDRGYVVVQSTARLTPVRDGIEEALRLAREQDLAVLELPLGPLLGDHNRALSLSGEVASLSAWPPPRALTALLAGAAGIIHESLHAGVVGFAAGVPCLRLPGKVDSKYAQLDHLPGMHLLGRNGAALAFAAPRADGHGAGDVVRDAILGRLAVHWDTVAGLAGQRGAPPSRALVKLLMELPGRLQVDADQIAQNERGLAGTEEFAAAYRAFAHRTDELGRELAELRSVSPPAPAPEADQDELRYLRDRDATLQRVLDGGWWRLRERVLPALRLVGRSRD